MSDTANKKNKKKTTQPVVNKEVILDLLSSKIDDLEHVAAPSYELLSNELQELNERMEELNKIMALKEKQIVHDVNGSDKADKSDSASGSGSGSGSVNSSSSAEEVKRWLLDLYKTEYQNKLVLTRMYGEERDKNARVNKQKTNLENLCKELQKRNKIMSEQISSISSDQMNQHKEMREKFEHSLLDIQEQIKKHEGERLNQQKENEKLREDLSQLLKFDKMREEHFNQQLKTKELEIKLLEAKLAQQADFAAAESNKSKLQQEKLNSQANTETQLRQQLNGYAEKFEQVQMTLTKSNELFATFKQEMEKTANQMKKLEKEKISLEKKNNASQLTIIQMFEERQTERANYDKLKRQKDTLQALCIEMEKEKKQWKLFNSANDTSALASLNEKENMSEHNANTNTNNTDADGTQKEKDANQLNQSTSSTTQ